MNMSAPIPDSPLYRSIDGAFMIQHHHQVGYKAMKGFHLHDSYEIFYLLKGERVYFINDRVYTARQGDLVVINPHVLHRTTTSSDVLEYERILLDFRPDFVQSYDSKPGEELLPFAQGSCMVRFPAEEQPEIERIVRELLTECKDRRLGYEACLKASLTRLLVRIRRQSAHSGHQPNPFANPLHQKISEIVSFINVNYADAISLKDVAALFHISPYYLCRLFRKLTGFHFREYVTAVRVKEAQRLLRSTEAKIIDIAQQVGFEHVSHFNTTFKKMVKQTPLKFRQTYRNGG